jgi:H+/Cl- antiporter ClcA
MIPVTFTTEFPLVSGGHGQWAKVPWSRRSRTIRLAAGRFVVIPVVGGLLYGPLICNWAREARGHGVPEVMIAVADEGGRIRPQVSVVKAVASALCIGVGGSVGREGPIVQIGSALASSLGQWIKMPEAECGSWSPAAPSPPPSTRRSPGCSSGGDCLAGVLHRRAVHRDAGGDWPSGRGFERFAL